VPALDLAPRGHCRSISRSNSRRQGPDLLNIDSATWPGVGSYAEAASTAGKLAAFPKERVNL